MKTPLFRICILTMAFGLFYGCERELERYDLISFERCASENVVVDPFLVTDFECQSNIEISGVDVIRNPSETGANTSRFVGQYTDGASAIDGLTINFADGLDLSTNGLFKFKIKTNTTGTLQVQLVGGSGGQVNYDVIINGNERWIEYQLDLSDQEDQTFTQINLNFNNGIENNGNDVYLIDDLKFDPTIDPCESTVTDLSIISDFECQQNYFLGDPAQGETVVPVVENPSVGGINRSASVGRYIDNGTEPFDNLLINFEEPIDLSENAQFNIKVRSNRAGPVLAKLEGGSMAVERSANIPQANQWVELTFDFTAAQNAGNTRLILFFNAGNTNGTETDTYFIDDLRFVPFVNSCEGVTPNLSIISDFECQQNYTLSNPNNVPAVVNPDPDGVNSSELVGRYTDNGTDPFDFLLIDYGQAIDLSQNAQLNIKVRSSRLGPLTAKLEGGQAVEITTNIDVTGDWKNYTFDFSQAAGDGNTRIILFFNAGRENGTPQDIYFIDDLRFLSAGCTEIVNNCAGVAADLTIINDFDCQQNFTFANANDVTTVPNPMISCENRSSNVGRYVDNGTDSFDNTSINFGEPIDLSVNNQFKIKVLAREAGPFLAKLEGGTAAEIYMDVTVLNEWVEYTFDFSGSAGDNNTRLVLFFNAGEQDGTAQDVYFIDDLRFEAP